VSVERGCAQRAGAGSAGRRGFWAGQVGAIARSATPQGPCRAGTWPDQVHRRLPRRGVLPSGVSRASLPGCVDRCSAAVGTGARPMRTAVPRGGERDLRRGVVVAAGRAAGSGWVGLGGARRPVDRSDSARPRRRVCDRRARQEGAARLRYRPGGREFAGGRGSGLPRSAARRSGRRRRRRQAAATPGKVSIRAEAPPAPEPGCDTPPVGGSGGARGGRQPPRIGSAGSMPVGPMLREPDPAAGYAVVPAPVAGWV
jgi:hypothetical protein